MRSALALPKSCTEAITHMYHKLSVLLMAKGTSRDEVTLVSGKIKPVAIVVMELCLSEGFKVSS